MNPLHALLKLLGAGASHLPGAALAQGLGAANQIHNAQAPQQIPLNGYGDPRFLQGSLPRFEDLSGVPNPQDPNYAVQAQMPRFFSTPQLQQPANIPIGGFHRANTNVQAAHGPIGMNNSDFRDTQIQVPRPPIQVQNRPNNQQIRI